MTSILAIQLAGRCRNGAERDHGRLYHALPEDGYVALCGAKPGRRSVGWSSHTGTEVTCPRCLKRLADTTPADEGRS